MPDSETSGSPHIDEGTLHAWLDGALTDVESAAVRRHVAECGSCANAAAAARGLIAASTRILSALDDVPAGVIPGGGHVAGAAAALATQGNRPRASLRSVRWSAPIAAAAALAITATLLSRTSSAPPDRPAPVAEKARVVMSNEALGKPQAPRTLTAPAHRSADNLAAPRPPTVTSGPRSAAELPSLTQSAALTTSAASVAKAASGESVAREKSRGADVRQVAEAADAAAASPSNDSIAITGRVVTAVTGEPIKAANVAVVGTATAVTTDSTGAFSISGVSPGNHTIVARQIGFGATRKQVDVPVDRAVAITFALPRAPLALSDAVVSGAATLRKVDFGDSPPVISGAHVVSSEQSVEPGMHTRSTLYQLSSGVRFTLTESRPGSVSPKRASPAASNRAGAAKAVAMASGSVTWSGSDGTSFVLSGQLTDAELAAIKTQIAR